MMEDGGIFLTQTLMGHKLTNQGDPWLDNYSFLNVMLRLNQQISNAACGLFEIRDIQTFGHYYEIAHGHW